jgi:hypothetical protein
VSSPATPPQREQLLADIVEARLALELDAERVDEQPGHNPNQLEMTPQTEPQENA